jgi:hypothetical protein
LFVGFYARRPFCSYLLLLDRAKSVALSSERNYSGQVATPLIAKLCKSNYTILVQIKSFDLNRLQQLCVPLPFQMQEDERGEIKFEIVVR